MAKALTYLPSDPLFPLQWHLLNQGNTPGSVAGYDINVISVWPDYTGRGVLIGVVDDGLDQTHPDLISNYRSDLAWDLYTNTAGAASRHDDDDHGTSVSGLAAAASNGVGGVGVAWGAEFTMYRLDFDRSDDDLLMMFGRAADKLIADGAAISSNSWGPGPSLKPEVFTAYHAAGRKMAEAGRDGLGIVTLFAAGNGREEKNNTNYDPADTSPWVTLVAAGDQAGGVTSYSTAGAAVLITAPGSDPSSMVTTDRQGVDGYNDQAGEAGNYTDRGGSFFDGTSAATPVAAGVVALVLEANSRLGYRDVQEILAYSAKRATFLDRDSDHAFNGARDWNGGALLASHDFGYGHIDAHAAVRLAESWAKTSTVSNLVLEQGHVAQGSLTIGAGQQAVAKASFTADHRVEQVAVTLHLETEKLNKVTVELISPDGMVSRLIDQPDFDEKSVGPQVLTVPTNTVLNWGSGLAGDWTLRVSAAADGASVELKDWSILAYTAGSVGGGTQVFTDEFARFAQVQADRKSLDAADGVTLNAAAVTSDVRFDLDSGVSWIGSTGITLADADAFRHLVSGDGDDILIGNGGDNILMAGRGSNHVDGGAGLDVARFIGEFANYSFARHEDVTLVQSAELAGGVRDVVSNVEILHFSDQVVLTNKPIDMGPGLFDETGYLDQNPDVAAAVAGGRIASGFDHYAHWGASEGRNPNALFNEKWYLARNDDVAAAVEQGAIVSGYQHYQSWGWSEGRTPSGWMDTAAYLRENSDVAAAQLDPLQHYLLYGINEGRAISALSVDMWA